MRSDRRKNKRTKTLLLTTMTVIVLLALSALTFIDLNDKQLAEKEAISQVDDNTTNENELENEETAIPIEEEDIEEVIEERFTNLRISAAGDIMFHMPQVRSAYDHSNNTYNFNPVFEKVAPILSAADLSIVNFESTLGGAKRGFSGYPLFNSPDEAAAAIKEAGVDVVTTANNHSLDSGKDGLKRTVQVFHEQGVETVGTYAEKPVSRVLLKEMNEINIAILAYTESTNGLGGQYATEELNSMLNLMEIERILEDVAEAKLLGADFIIAYLHWGDEYMQEPNEKQIEYATMMAEAGVHLILGSHPHVIQKSDVIKTEGHETFVVYSLGNFVSNQRKETLGASREITEDGLIVTIDIEKNHLTNETAITNVEYTPTWVYRHPIGGNKYSYKILLITDSLLSDEISQEYKNRMERSYEATMAKMIDYPYE